MASVEIPRKIYVDKKYTNALKPLELDPLTFVLFGATGDLAKRKIFPSLYHLFLDKKMPDSFTIIGIGRRDWSDEIFQSQVEKSLQSFSRKWKSGEETELNKFLSVFKYRQLDVTDSEGYKKLLGMIHSREEELEIPENRLFYLSVAPEYFDVITSNIKGSGLGTIKGWKRLCYRKTIWT